MRRIVSIALFALAVATFVACGDSEPDHEAATQRFAECLERNGITARDVNVILNDDGTVGTIEVGIVGEADAAYEPVVRLGCTQEVEAHIDG